jgi:DME family drug/metabolite transporter
MNSAEPPSATTMRAVLAGRTGLFAVSGGALLWGTTGVLVRFVHERAHLSAVSIGFYRLLFASAVMLALQGWPVLRLLRRSTAAEVGGLALAGLGLGLYQALYFASVQDAGVSISTLVSLGVAPIAVVAGQAVRRRQLPAAAPLATTLCAVAGLALVSLGGSAGASGQHVGRGLLEALASGCGYGGSTVLSARLTRLAPPLTLTASTCMLATLVLLPAAAWSGLGFVVDGAVVSSLMYLGVVATALAYGLFFSGLRSTPSEVASVLTLLEPLTAGVLAAALLGERLTAIAFVGAAVLLVAIGVLYFRAPAAAVSAIPTDGTPTGAIGAPAETIDQ